MKRHFIAVTVSQYYISPNTWAIKYLHIIHRQDRTPVWWVVKQGRRYVKFTHAEARVKIIAQQEGVPYIEDVRQGERVSYIQLKILEKYGFDARPLHKTGG